MSKKATLIILASSVLVLIISVGFRLNREEKCIETECEPCGKNLHELRIYNYERMFDSESNELHLEKSEVENANSLEKLDQTSLINFSRNKCAWFIYGPKDGRINGTLTLLHQIC